MADDHVKSAQAFQPVVDHGLHPAVQTLLAGVVGGQQDRLDVYVGRQDFGAQRSRQHGGYARPGTEVQDLVTRTHQRPAVVPLEDRQRHPLFLGLGLGVFPHRRVIHAL